jgi:hypothetical protein
MDFGGRAFAIGSIFALPQRLCMIPVLIEAVKVKLMGSMIKENLLKTNLTGYLVQEI